MYKPAIVISDASDFSNSIWIQSSDNFTQILVDAAVEREKQSYPNEAPYQVLVKALSNQKSPCTKVTMQLKLFPIHSIILLG